MLKWLGVEANARAVTTLLLIGAAFGGIVVFAADRVLPIADPNWNQGAYGEGYRSANRETELMEQIRALETQIKVQSELQSIHDDVRAVESMSREELIDSLADDSAN